MTAEQPGRPGSSPGRPGHGTVTVTLPYWRTPATIRRAVEAVLGQTYADLLLYVVNDGDDITPPWERLADITDRRLVRVDLPVNRGRYFCDAAVLAATRTPWFAIHDADDAAEPEWLETLVDAAARHYWGAAFAPQLVVDEAAEARLDPVTGPLLPRHGRLRHIAHHAAVYRTAALRQVGGPHPGYRIGYDTLMVNLLVDNVAVGAVDRVLYTRYLRPGSLTTSPTTRTGSRARRTVRTELNVLLARSRRDGVRTAIARTIPAELAAAVTDTAAAIRSLDPVALMADRPCCDLHTTTCEAPSELCCAGCSEAAHTGLIPHADGSVCVLEAVR